MTHFSKTFAFFSCLLLLSKFLFITLFYLNVSELKLTQVLRSFENIIIQVSFSFHYMSNDKGIVLNVFSLHADRAFDGEVN